jgi:glutamate--cysteine ligase
MSLDAQQTQQRPIGSVHELIQFFADAERPAGHNLIGLEHERLMFPIHGAGPVPYEGAAGIGKLLTGFSELGFQEFREAATLPVIAMQRGLETLSLEPGGQFELSGSPFSSAQLAASENLRHVAELKQVAGGLGLRAIGLGYRPFGELADMVWMPKSRYRLMRDSLGARGRLAHHMMLMTATAQVSLDWHDEADCVGKVTAAARLSPLLVALFANSPLAQGKPSGALSFRSQVWNEVDPARCGYPQAMLDGSFSYRAYVEWALDAPMLFLRRDGRYLDPQLNFRAFLAKGYDGVPALHSDWVDHLSTLFPEVRLKKVLEIRAADGNGPVLANALAALMRGVLYDGQAREEASQLLPRLSPNEHRALHASAQIRGLAAQVGAGTLADYAIDLVAIAAAGLKRLPGDDAPLLEPLAAIVATRQSPAVRVLDHFAREKDPAIFLRHYEL